MTIVARSVKTSRLSEYSILLLNRSFRRFRLTRRTTLLRSHSNFLISGNVPLSGGFANFHVRSEPFHAITLRTIFPKRFLVRLMASSLHRVVATKVVGRITRRNHTTFFYHEFTKARLFVGDSRYFFYVLHFVLLRHLFSVSVVVRGLRSFFVKERPRHASRMHRKRLTIAISASKGGTINVDFRFSPHTTIQGRLNKVSFLPRDIRFLFMMCTKETSGLKGGGAFNTVSGGYTHIHRGQRVTRRGVVLLSFTNFLVSRLSFSLRQDKVDDVSHLTFVSTMLFFLRVMFTRVRHPFVDAVLSEEGVHGCVPRPFFARPFMEFNLRVRRVKRPRGFLDSNMNVSFLDACLSKSRRFTIERSAPRPFLPCGV